MEELPADGAARKLGLGKGYEGDEKGAAAAVATATAASFGERERRRKPMVGGC